MVISFPEKFSRRVSTAIETGQLVAENRSAFVRECVDFYEPIIPTPTREQFNEISRGLCDRYPTLKDVKKTVYWVCGYIVNNNAKFDMKSYCFTGYSQRSDLTTIP